MTRRRRGTRSLSGWTTPPPCPSPACPFILRGPQHERASAAPGYRLSPGWRVGGWRVLRRAYCGRGLPHPNLPPEGEGTPRCPAPPIPAFAGMTVALGGAGGGEWRRGGGSRLRGNDGERGWVARRGGGGWRGPCSGVVGFLREALGVGAVPAVAGRAVREPPLRSGGGCGMRGWFEVEMRRPLAPLDSRLRGNDAWVGVGLDLFRGGLPPPPCPSPRAPGYRLSPVWRLGVGGGCGGIRVGGDSPRPAPLDSCLRRNDAWVGVGVDLFLGGGPVRPAPRPAPLDTGLRRYGGWGVLPSQE